MLHRQTTGRLADLAPGLACAGAIGGGAAEGRGDITGTSRVTGVLVRCSKSRTEVRSCMRKI